MNERIKLKPFLVPHRDEFSETVVYEILINNKALIFIADIDKWETNINELIQKVDFAFLDATFYKNGQFIYLLPKLTIPIGLRTSTTSSLETRYNYIKMKYEFSKRTYLELNRYQKSLPFITTLP